jgi:nucleoside-specific outer membrane channel protein Tsx
MNVRISTKREYYLAALMVMCLAFATSHAWAQQDSTMPSGEGQPAAQQAPSSQNAGTQPAGQKIPAEQHVRFFSDTAIGYLYGPYYRTPFVTSPSQPNGADIARNTIEIVHTDSWKYGSNFIDINLRKSSDAEPALGGTTGALEVYGIFRSDFNLNGLTGTSTFAIGPLRDIALEFGANLESKNSHYAPEERTLYLGPNFQFKIPKGFLNLGLHLRKEWNHQGITGKDEDYSPNFNVEITWSIPLPTGRVPLKLEGFCEINTPKGTDSFGSPTHTEFLLHPRLMLDLGAIAFKKPHLLEVGGGYEYWYNMYGKQAYVKPGAVENTPFLKLTLHLP